MNLKDLKKKEKNPLYQLHAIHGANNVDEIVKVLQRVTPAKAGIQKVLNLLDSDLRRMDEIRHSSTFYESMHIMIRKPLYIEPSLLMAHQ